MKVFISWSGKLSHAVALALHDWLPSVIQDIDPYVSSANIEKGARWESELAKELEESDIGIVCLTRDNITSPWLNFEAGALAKHLGMAQVIPFLFDMQRADVPNSSPLSHFQSTIVERDDIGQMVRDINAKAEKRLPTVFDKWWPDLHKRLEEIANDHSLRTESQPPLPDAREMIAEVLDLVRAQRRDISILLAGTKLSQQTLAPISTASPFGGPDDSYRTHLRTLLQEYFPPKPKPRYSSAYLTLLRKLTEAMADFHAEQNREPLWDELAKALGHTPDELTDLFMHTRPFAENGSDKDSAESNEPS